MYQSVFVIAEEKNECIIATEVRLFFFYRLFTEPKDILVCFLSATDPLFSSFF